MSIEARAVRIEGAGGPEVLKLATLSVRDPGPDEVRVRVAAAGLNRADCLQRRGVYPAPRGVVPDVPGLEYAGTVEAVGSEVSDVRVGARVMGICGGGSMATHLVVNAGELVPVPDGMSLEHAAAIPEAFMTAYDALVLQGGLGLGQTALIHAVASGVGTAALQLVRALGATAVGTSRSEAKLEQVRALGLTHGICTASGSFADELKRLAPGLAHVVLDTIGAKYLAENIKAAAPGGRIVTIGLLGGAKGELPLGLLVAKRVSITGSVLRSRSLGEKLALAQSFRTATQGLFAQGALRPVVAEVLPMAEIQRAHAKMEADEVVGKLVLRWQD
jgi:NADPH:quinone reductase